jgi:hypothetical protein
VKAPTKGGKGGMSSQSKSTTVVVDKASSQVMVEDMEFSGRLLSSSGSNSMLIPQTDRQTENIASAYLKCYHMLEESTSVTGGIMGQEEFVVFIMKMTDGELSFDRFADLPPLFDMIFSMAACKTESDCLSGNKTQFEIGNTFKPNDEIQLLCQQTLKSTFNTAQSALEYFIRLSSDAIDESNLATCISTAAVNVLLREHAGCPVIAEVAASKQNKQLLRNSQYYVQNKERQLQRGLESLGYAGTTGDSMCAYDIAISVDRFTELRKFHHELSVF